MDARPAGRLRGRDDGGNGAVSRVRERYAHYYLEYAQQHSNDWAWFDNEWPQIQRAWEWVSEQDDHEALVLNFVWALRLYQEGTRGSNPVGRL